MKKSIFITGIAGSGKSTISKTFRDLGYESYDIEDLDDMFIMVRKDTGELFVDYDNSDLSKVNNSRWICNIEKLKELVDNQKEGIAFYCGIASNNLDLMDLFDKSLLLSANPEEINNRLLPREGTSDHSNTEAGRNRVLGYKDEFEQKMLNAGMVIVNANSNPKEIVTEILRIISY